MLAGAGMVRVHDVAATVQAATLVGDRRSPDRIDAVMRGTYA
jgi:dihydropteroate synthase